MWHIKCDTIGLDKDTIIKRLQSRLEETLTLHYIMVDQLIYENGKGYEYFKLCEQLYVSLSRCEQEKRQLMKVIEDLKKNIVDLKVKFFTLLKLNDFNISISVQRQMEKMKGHFKQLCQLTREIKIERNDELLTTGCEIIEEDSECRQFSSVPETCDNSGWSQFSIVRQIQNLWRFITLRNYKNHFAWLSWLSILEVKYIFFFLFSFPAI